MYSEEGIITMKKLLQKNETYIFLTFVVLSLLVQFRSGQFFTVNNVVDILVSMIVPGMFGMCVLVVIVSGGIDISFPALASLCMFATTKILLMMNFTGSVLWAFVIAALFGLVLGAFNGMLISFLNLPTLIITLGTSSIFIGVMQGVLNAQEIYILPKPMQDFGNAKLFVAANKVSGLTSNMSSTVLIFIGIVVITALILRYTMLGRGIYAIGGDVNSAVRAGFDVKRIKFFIYCFVGVIAGIDGMTRTIMIGNCLPTNLLGTEMTVIAAVVLGGISITGGSGTITGALLGTALITIMSNSLLLLGIPTYWQSFFTGLLIITGIGISSFQVIRSKNKLPGITDLQGGAVSD